MLRQRIIPCLLIQDGALVKTVNFKEPKYIGDPINAVKIFNEKKADEIVILDISITKKNLDPNFRLIKSLVKESRMPLCYGGGIKSIEQAKKIISFGVEKISLGTAAIKNIGLIRELIKLFGSQSIVITLDVIADINNDDFNIFINNGKENTNYKLFNTIKNLEDLGVGEIIINSIELDGTMAGYDLDLAKKLYKNTKIPLTILGGAGNLNDIRELFNSCKYIGASAGSLFVYKGEYKAVLINYPSIEQKKNLFELLI